MPATLEAPPSNTPKGVDIVDAGPPKPPPAPTSTIRVSEMPQSPEPFVPAKPGTARARLQNDLRKKAGMNPNPEPAPAKGEETPSPGTESTQTSNPPETTPETTPAPETSPATQPATTPEHPAAKDKKTNPWKLVDEWKGRATTLEKELVEIKKQVTPETERKAYDERVKKSEERAQALENEIRYHNYEMSSEFQDQFQKPYEDAFRRAMSDLSEVQVPAENGQMRNLSGDDLAQFSQMSFVAAKEAANRLFPDFADDILAALRELRSLWDKKQGAIKEWKEKGSKLQQERSQAAQNAANEIAGHIKTTWEKVNSQALEDPVNGEYFKPKEGDEEWNQRLSKGFELVDRAYSENPSDPRLTPEARASVIKRHAAVRNRAASWGALKNENVKLKAQLDEVNKALAGYKKSTPPLGGSVPNGQPSGTSSAMSDFSARLRKLAHVE